MNKPWYIKSPKGYVAGPLTEEECKSSLRNLKDASGFLVKQGSSDWKSAKSVLALFDKLDQEGIFIEHLGSIVGPYTDAKYRELESKFPRDAKYRRGLSGEWIPIKYFEALNRKPFLPENTTGKSSEPATDATLQPVIPVVSSHQAENKTFEVSPKNKPTEVKEQAKPSAVAIFFSLLTLAVFCGVCGGFLDKFNTDYVHPDGMAGASKNWPYTPPPVDSALKNGMSVLRLDGIDNLTGESDFCLFLILQQKQLWGVVEVEYSAGLPIWLTDDGSVYFPSWLSSSDRKSYKWIFYGPENLDKKVGYATVSKSLRIDNASAFFTSVLDGRMNGIEFQNRRVITIADIEAPEFSTWTGEEDFYHSSSGRKPTKVGGGRVEILRTSSTSKG